MESYLVDEVIVEVTDEGIVTRVAEHVVEVGCSQTSVVRSELVDEVDACFGGSVDGDRVAAVSVEVSTKGNISRIAEEESNVGDPLVVRIAEVDEPIRLPLEPGRFVPIAVPVADKGEVPGVPIEEPGRFVPEVE